MYFYFYFIFFSKALFLEKINRCSLGHKNIGKDAVSYLNPSSYHEKKLLFLICLQKMVFVTRFAEAFKGYICIYFANLEREIAESFDGFWKVTVDDHVYIR